jgi:pimeloyl-ACP methyl ester carboxylesterase
LAQVGYWVVRFDNRDVGQSEKFPSQDYRIEDMADDTAGLLDALQLESAHIVGQSMGGMIAQELALRHPGRVASLALIYTTASSAWLLPSVTDRVSPPVTDRDSAIRAYLDNERWAASKAYAQDREWLAHLGGQAYDRDPEQAGVHRQFTAVMKAPDRGERVGDITAPTTILVGDADQLINPEASADLHARIPGSRYQVFPGLGHEVAMAVASAFVEEIDVNARRASVPASGTPVA